MPRPDAREIAIAFARLPRTEQERIAEALLVHRGNLPERNPDAMLEILRRVKRHNLVDDLAIHLGLEVSDG